MPNSFSEREFNRQLKGHRPILDSFDANRISFPTDNLTIKNLREVDAQGFGWNWQPASNNYLQSDVMEILGDTMHCERQLAAFTFGRKHGVPMEHTSAHLDPNDGREAILDRLDELYQKLGVSTSAAQSFEMASLIERQALQQGKGPSSGRLP